MLSSYILKWVSVCSLFFPRDNCFFWTFYISFFLCCFNFSNSITKNFRQKIWTNGTINIEIFLDSKIIFSYLLFSFSACWFPSHHLKLSFKVTDRDRNEIVVIFSELGGAQENPLKHQEMSYILIYMVVTHVKTERYTSDLYPLLCISSISKKRGFAGEVAVILTLYS